MERVRRRTTRDENSGERIFAFVVIAGLAFLAGRHVFLDDGREQTEVDTAAPGTAALDPVREAAPRTPTSPPAAPVTIERPTNAHTLSVFECVVNGQRVLSDQRCAEDARERTVVVAQPDPRDVARAQRRAAQQRLIEASRATTETGRPYSRPSGGAASVVPDNSTSCAQVDREIEWINARMRQAYTSQEGERLRARWHVLKERRWDLRCGR
jgi:hypothetical protein